MTGYEEWNLIKQVVILDENMRQKNDSIYAGIFSRLPIEYCGPEDLRTLNSRYYEKSSDCVTQIKSNLSGKRNNPDELFPFCVHDNKNRIKIIWDFIFDFSKRYNKSIILCMADFKRTKGSFTKNDLNNLKELYNCPDNKLDRFYAIFPLVEGTPVKIT
ncbi:MAG: hypothetical protein AAGH46_13030 [Bacteroidota bacterium]